jgi:ribosome-associated translation inhibitor RaiA
MQTPFQLTFHDLPPSPALQTRTRTLVADLEKTFDGIVSCRVAIEAPHRHHVHGRRYRVRIELGVPGETIVVGHATNDGAHENAYAALHDAFRAARRCLADHAGRMRDRVRRPAA